MELSSLAAVRILPLQTLPVGMLDHLVLRLRSRPTVALTGQTAASLEGRPVVTESTMERPVASRDAYWNLFDPAQFASSVRQFAMDVHRVLNDPLSTTSQLVELSRRIDDLRRHSPVPRFSEMDFWMSSAHRILDSQHHLRERCL
jgi:hypothetical protein